MTNVHERVLKPDRSARDLYGAEVRRYRTNAGMTLTQLAEVLNYSKTHLGNIETADRVVPPKLSEALDAAFGTDGHFVRLYGLARREAHPGKHRRFMDFEAEAVQIDVFAGHMIPGLLQTERYARTLLQLGAPEAPDDELNELVTARLSRQERLRGSQPPYTSFILDESVLRRAIGGAETMCEQLATLTPLLDTERCAIQVAPFGLGGHALLGGSMTLLTLADDTLVAYMEGIDRGEVVEEIAEVRRYRRAYDRLRAHAPSPRASGALITSAMEEHKLCEPPEPS